jgi:GNAT superfamily N-acetyltransferase
MPTGADSEEIRLRDGSRATIRPIEPADKALLAAAFAELGSDSRYRRFFTALETLDEHRLAYFTEIDHHGHEALVAIEPKTGAAVGVARFVRTRPAVAEPAIVVVDRWQRRGLGMALLARLADRACAEGITRFSGVMLAENRDALGLVEQLGEGALEFSGPEVCFEVALPEPDGIGGALSELLRAVAAGLLAPVRLLPAARGRPEDARGVR